MAAGYSFEPDRSPEHRQPRDESEMTILHVGCGYAPYPGGGALRALRLIEPLNRSLGANNIVITTVPDSAGKYTSTGSKDVSGVSIYRVPSFLGMVRLARKLVKAGGISVIHAHNARLALWFSLVLPRAPLALELHAMSELKGLKRMLFARAVKRVKAVIVLADGAKRYLVEQFGIADRRIHVIRNGIDAIFFAAPGGAQPAAGGHRRIGYVGTFYRWQGVHDLLEAVALARQTEPAIELHFAGQGPETAALKSRSAQLGFDGHVFFHGPIAPEAVPDFLQTMDVLALPRPSSLETETTVPLKVFEFMASGKAMVASDVGGLVEVLQPGIDCITYPAGNVDALRSALLRLAADCDLCARLGFAARENVRTQPRWVDQARVLKQTYSDLIALGR
jgi:glycosyltransferase involved in cell wall biosynthesis